MNMTPVSNCGMSSCAFNSKEMCHTRAINVGFHAECNTYVHGSETGGIKDVTGGIGACMASNCKFNDRLECTASSIGVSGHQIHADCKSFSQRTAEDSPQENKAILREAMHHGG